MKLILNLSFQRPRHQTLHGYPLKVYGLWCVVEDIEDSMIQEVRYLDKLVDELAKGRKMDKIIWI